MALDDFQMPNFRDEDGSVYVWDPTSKSYVRKPASDNRPDIGHATGGDNDLFDPFQHTEWASSPTTEGWAAGKTACLCDGDPNTGCPECGPIKLDNPCWCDVGPTDPHEWTGACEDGKKPVTEEEATKTGSFQDGPPFAAPDEVKCPNCQETTTEHVCPTCHKDLTPEWNTHGQDNEFFDTKPDFNDASEFWTWPQNVPKPNEQNYDNSFPSMSLSKTAAEDWDDIFAGTTPMRTEVGRWIATVDGRIHVGIGNILHEQIEARDRIDKSTEIALGSVYNDGRADTQQVYMPQYFNLQEIQSQLQQVFGQVTLQPPIAMQGVEQKSAVFPPFEITSGMWFIAPGRDIISGLAWVKERSNGIPYQPNMILCAEHLRPEDFALWANGVAAIVTATGGASSHATYLAMTQNIPVVTGIGDVYTKLETGNHVKIDPRRETITVMPGDVPHAQGHDAWNTILDYQRQKELEDPTLTPKPFAFSHVIEEEMWRLANEPNLAECPECSAPMVDQDNESVCHDCGHKQPIIQTTAAMQIVAGTLPMYYKYEQRNVKALRIEARLGGQLVGYLNAAPFGEGYGLDDIEVHPAYRRRGIASAMVSKGRELGMVPYTTLPPDRQVFRSPEGKLLAAKFNGDDPRIRTASIVTAGPAALVAPIAEGGGISQIGGMMSSALGRGIAFRGGENLIGGGHDNSGGGGGLAAPQAPIDPNIGTVAHTKFAVWNQRHAGVLSAIFEAMMDAAKNGGNWASAAAQNLGQNLSQAAQPVGTAFLHPLSPLSYGDDLLLGGIGQAQQQFGQQQTAATQFGEEEVGAAAKNDGTNSTDEASDSGTEGKKEQGDGPEQLKDVDGGHDSQGSGPFGLEKQIDPHLQDKALKAFHMNLPLVIEFAQSDEPGSENPILLALDQLLEEAFPGYKDGHDQENGAIDEYPQDKPESNKGGEPDEKSEGADKAEKKEAAALASVWHFADGLDLPGVNRDPATPNQWPHHEEEPYDYSVGDVIAAYPDGTIILDDGITTYNPDRAQQFAAEHGWSQDRSIPEEPTGQSSGQQWLGHVPKEASIWHYAWDPEEGNNMGGNSEPGHDEFYDELEENPECPECGGPGVPLGALGRKIWFRCRNCGMDFANERELPANTVDPGTLDNFPATGYDHEPDHPGYMAKTATLDPGQMGMGTVPAGAGGPTMQICPRCGQAHPGGTPCPVADVTTPLTTGNPQALIAPSTHVVTKWHLAMPSNMAAPAPQQMAGAPAAPTTCPLCHCNHIPGTPCPSYDNTQQPSVTGTQPTAPVPMSPGVSYSSQREVVSLDDHFALFDHDDSKDSDSDDYHSEDDWTDESGQPLQEGAEYEMKVGGSAIPDRVTIERILPEKLTYIIHSGDVDFRDTVTRDQLDFDGTVFSAVDYDNTGEDSMDRFPGEEMPPRPGDDGYPQQDDLSTTTTVVSAVRQYGDELQRGYCDYCGDASKGVYKTVNGMVCPTCAGEPQSGQQQPVTEFEPVSLENYTGSFQGDPVDDRAWLIEDSSPVAVDPVLMAKLAGKNYSPREQREFIDESGEARNLDRLDLEGTHYIDTDLHTHDSLW